MHECTATIRLLDEIQINNYFRFWITSFESFWLFQMAFQLRSHDYSILFCRILDWHIILQVIIFPYLNLIYKQ